MKPLLQYPAPAALFILGLLLLSCVAEEQGESSDTGGDEIIAGAASADDRSVEKRVSESGVVTVIVPNQGGDMEGHTPRGFRGMGTGLFAGDNLNPRFPEGDGVQFFLTFDLSMVPAGEIDSAILRSDNGHVRGTPFEDLGHLVVEEVRYATFSPALQGLEPLSGGAACVLGTAPEGPFECALTETIQRSLDDEYGSAQFRLRLEQAGDGDGAPDMVSFYITDSNTNEPGIFELKIAMAERSDR